MSKKDIQDTNQADQTTSDTTTAPEDTQEPVVEKVEKTKETKEKVTKSTATKTVYFRNKNISSLAFNTPDKRLHRFRDGVFATDEPEVIEALKKTLDYKHGHIKEFTPKKD
ncbi:MAG: hypothetical protein WCO66_02445 [Candidatus Absconditabacteria bacterium]